MAIEPNVFRANLAIIQGEATKGGLNNDCAKSELHADSWSNLYNFLANYNTFYTHQFCFRASHSVDHALISKTELIKNTLDNKRYGCGIFIDIQKAFDTVNHQIFLATLEH